MSLSTSISCVSRMYLIRTHGGQTSLSLACAMSRASLLPYNRSLLPYNRSLLPPQVWRGQCHVPPPVVKTLVVKTLQTSLSLAWAMSRATTSVPVSDSLVLIGYCVCVCVCVCVCFSLPPSLARSLARSLSVCLCLRLSLSLCR